MFNSVLCRSQPSLQMMQEELRTTTGTTFRCPFCNMRTNNWSNSHSQVYLQFNSTVQKHVRFLIIEHWCYSFLNVFITANGQLMNTSTILRHELPDSLKSTTDIKIWVIYNLYLDKHAGNLINFSLISLNQFQSQTIWKTDNYILSTKEKHFENFSLKERNPILSHIYSQQAALYNYSNNKAKNDTDIWQEFIDF